MKSFYHINNVAVWNFVTNLFYKLNVQHYIRIFFFLKMVQLCRNILKIRL